MNRQLREKRHIGRLLILPAEDSKGDANKRHHAPIALATKGSRPKAEDWKVR